MWIFTYKTRLKYCGLELLRSVMHACVFIDLLLFLGIIFCSWQERKRQSSDSFFMPGRTTLIKTTSFCIESFSHFAPPMLNWSVVAYRSLPCSVSEVQHWKTHVLNYCFLYTSFLFYLTSCCLSAGCHHSPSNPWFWEILFRMNAFFLVIFPNWGGNYFPELFMFTCEEQVFVVFL